MKKLAKKIIINWHVVGGILIAVYESASYLFNFDWIPLPVKVVVGVIAFAGFVYKNYNKQTI